MTDTKWKTVKDLKQLLETLPDDMPLFYINDYESDCFPISENHMPSVETVSELEFPQWRSFHSGPRDGLIPHKVIREFQVLNIS